MPLRAPVAPAALQAIDTAFKKLEKAIAPGDALGFSDTTLQDVRDAALQIEEQMASRGKLRNMKRLMSLFTVFEHYSGVMDVLCNGTPYLPWVWAPIKFILRITSEYADAFDILTSAYARLAEAMPRVQLLSRTFERNPEFQKTLTVYYADILAFHGHAYAFVRRRGWYLLFKTSWGRFRGRFDNLLENMRRHECLIDSVAISHHIAASAVERDANKAMRDELRKWLEDKNSRLAETERNDASQFATIVAWLKVDESATDQLSLFEKLSSEGARFDGTCSWILQDRNIKSWLGNASDPSLVLFEGAPGVGKSVLAAKLVAFLRAAGKFAVGHFCSYAYTKSIAFDQVLRSLILQLLRRDPELVSYAVEKYVLTVREPSTNVLQDLLKHLVANLGASVGDPNQRDGPGRPAPAGQPEHMWIVLDGLDECTPSAQESIISLVRQLTARSSCYSPAPVGREPAYQAPDGRNSGLGVICKVLIASRPVATINGRKRRGFTTVSLSKEKENLDGAIREYTRGRLGEDMGDRLHQLRVDPAEQDVLVDAIVRKADGMFLYACLLLNHLSANLFYTSHELLESVNRLPDELAMFYRSVLSRILANLDERSSERLRCFFGWIAFSKRPLKKLEFMSAVTFSQGDPTVKHLVPRYLFETMTSLVEERSDSALGFIHVSVKDFLQSPESPLVLTESLSIQEHGIATITCLLSSANLFSTNYTEDERLQRIVHGLHGLHIYATEYWVEYLLEYASSKMGASIQNGAESPDILDLALQLADEMQNRHQFDSIPPAEYTPKPVSADTTRSSSLATPSDQSRDKRLCNLENFPRLQQCIVNYFNARSLEGLSAAFDEEDANPGPRGKAQNRKANSKQQARQEGIHALLCSYQAALSTLLDQPDFPGVSAADLRHFKDEFHDARYTCRLMACPRASLGFGSNFLRREHEQVHLRRFFHCKAADCQWPPFESSAALQRHKKKYHSESDIPKRIMRSSKPAPLHRLPPLPPQLDTDTINHLLRDFLFSSASPNQPNTTHNMSPMSSSTSFIPSSEVTSQERLDQGARKRPAYFTVWYCCNCGNGPMKLSDSCSPTGCSHPRCDDCSEEEVEYNPDDYKSSIPTSPRLKSSGISHAFGIDHWNLDEILSIKEETPAQWSFNKNLGFSWASGIPQADVDYLEIDFSTKEEEAPQFYPIDEAIRDYQEFVYQTSPNPKAPVTSQADSNPVDIDELLAHDSGYT